MSINLKVTATTKDGEELSFDLLQTPTDVTTKLLDIEDNDLLAQEYIDWVICNVGNRGNHIKKFSGWYDHHINAKSNIEFFGA